MSQKKVNPYAKKATKSRRITKKQRTTIVVVLCVAAIIAGIIVAAKLSGASAADPHAGHNHATGEEHLDASVGKVLHGGHAAAVVVGDGVEGADFLHGAVFHFDEGVDLTMAEMHAHVGVEAAGQAGGNSNKHGYSPGLVVVRASRPVLIA